MGSVERDTHTYVCDDVYRAGAEARRPRAIDIGYDTKHKTNGCRYGMAGAKDPIRL